MSKINYDEVQRLYDNHLTFSEISRQLNVSVASISLWAKRNGLKSHNKDLLNELHQKVKELHSKGWNDVRIAKALNYGSSRIQYIRKEILGLKTIRKNQNLVPTEPQLQMIVGGLLGDSSISPASSNTYKMSFAHSLEQEEYFMWKYNAWENLCGVYGRKSHKDPRTNNTYHSIYTGFRAAPYVDDLYPIFYDGEKRALNDFSFIEKHLSPLALAVWYGDDGCNGSFATMSYSEKERKQLADLLSDLYKLDVTLHSNGCIYVKRKSVRQLKEVIGDLLPKSMHYKLLPLI